jgi:hypothetical protein
MAGGYDRAVDGSAKKSLKTKATILINDQVIAKTIQISPQIMPRSNSPKLAGRSVVSIAEPWC